MDGPKHCIAEVRRQLCSNPFSMEASPHSASNPPDIPWDAVVRFIRQLSHDLRNHLNAIELQSAFIGEIASEQEMKDEVKRLREMLSSAGAALQKLSADMGHARINSMPYKAADLVEDLRQRIESRRSESTPRIEWETNVGEGMVEVDPQLFPLVVQELIDNAVHFPSAGPLQFKAALEANGSLAMTLLEPKAEFARDVSTWGREPLKNIHHGHYGLGLNRARIIVEMHGGTLEASYDPKAKNLVTRIVLPGHQ